MSDIEREQLAPKNSESLLGDERTSQRQIEESLKEHRDRLQLALSAARMAVWVQDLETGRITWSKEVTELFGSLELSSSPDQIERMLHPMDLPKLFEVIQRALTFRTPQACELRFIGKDQKIRRMSFWGQAGYDGNGNISTLLGTIQDVTEQRNAELLLRGQNLILDQIAKGAKLQEVLHEVVRLVESMIDGGLCSVLLLDADGQSLRLASAPSLPAEFNRAVSIVPVGPQVGSCGTCVYRREPVYVSDIASDPLWIDYRTIAIANGLVSCLSVPIVSSELRESSREPLPTPRPVIGTFALYRKNATPEYEPAEVTAVLASAAQLAGVAIERDLANARLRASEERYRHLLEAVPAGILVHSEGQIEYCNAALLRIAGYTHRSQLVGSSVWNLMPKERIPIVADRVKALRAGASAYAETDEYLVRRDGNLVPVRPVATVIAEGDRRLMLTVLLDRSEQRRSDELLRSIMSSVTDAIITTDRTGAIVAANSASARMFDYPPSELLGKNISVLLPPPFDLRSEGSLAEQSLRSGQTELVGTTRELFPVQKGGRTFPAEVTVSCFLLNGEPHYTGVIRDISARRRLEEQLRQSQKMEAIGQLAGGVAHDFNNLLTVINGYSDRLLELLAPGDPLQDVAADIRAAGEKAAELTAQLLAFSRRAIIEPKILDLNQMVQSITRMLRRLIGEDIGLFTQLRPGIPHIRIDPVQLEQVLINLSLNARDAMVQGGRLVISTAVQDLAPGHGQESLEVRPGRYVVLSVQDTGMGMTEEAKPRIFEPFFTTKGVGKGSGLGLATVYGIVRQAGGHISFESEFGKGTTFRVLLPAQGREPLLGRTMATQGAPLGSETVLLAEDAEVVRKMIRQTLELLGYKVIDAECGQQALERESQHAGEIDLLLTDVVMPDFGGRTLADAVRKRRPTIKVLYMSGYMEDSVTRHGVESLVDAFLQKPFSSPTLAMKVRAVLDGTDESSR